MSITENPKSLAPRFTKGKCWNRIRRVRFFFACFDDQISKHKLQIWSATNINISWTYSRLQLSPNISTISLIENYIFWRTKCRDRMRLLGSYSGSFDFQISNCKRQIWSAKIINIPFNLFWLKFSLNILTFSLKEN